MSKTSTEVKKRWNDAHYDRIEITVPKGDREKLKQIAESRNMKLPEFIRYCIKKEIE